MRVFGPCLSTLLLGALVGGSAIAQANSTFGIIETAVLFQIDSGGGFTFVVSKANADIVSIKYRGVEYQDLAGPYVRLPTFMFLSTWLGSILKCVFFRGRNMIQDSALPTSLPPPLGANIFLFTDTVLRMEIQ